ncbi:putative GMC oxidoreductase [Daldinia sp. FL1419]|nr:putative GMC oxidoreductase [Daldinia sp. FL1419]
MGLLISLVLISLGVPVRCETFDYVIAGAGTCGLLLANRLSEDPSIKVAVIEPGDDVRNNPNVTDVGAFLRAFNTEIDWQYNTTPQPGANNKSIPFHAGKAIGGTSTINGMTYIRGDKAEFDAWESLGNDDWNWEILYPYFKRVEQFSPPTAAQQAAGASFDAEYHGKDGLMKTGFPFRLINGSFYELAQQTWESLGYPLNQDVNSGETRGFGVWPQTLDRDQNIREDAARAFYYPIEKRPNLKVIKGIATKVTWMNSLAGISVHAANGLEYLDPAGQTITINVTNEVILSTGSLRSPLILERSGIGNPNILQQYGIEAKVDLPGVGENLQDQPNVALEYTSNMSITGTAPYVTFATAEDIFGEHTSAIAEETSAELSEWARKVSEANNGAINSHQLEKIFRIQHDLMFKAKITIAESLTSASGNVLLSAFWPLLPFSRGSVHLRSAETNDPAIDPKYFLVDFDLNIQIKLGRLSQSLWYTSPINNLVVGDLVPRDETLPRNATDAQWAAFITSTVSPNHHPIGTLSMMSRGLGGVVDHQFKVYGTSNVRVIDASVLPMQISGHLTATLYAMSERAAEFIKSSYYENLGYV